MTPKELHDRFRSEVQDEALPYLWTEDEVWAYMDWAHKMFVRLMGGIVDSTSGITQIEAVAGEEFGTYSDCILKIRFARRVSDDRIVDVYDFSDLGRESGDDYGAATRLLLTSRTGPVRAMLTGMEENMVRWIDIPSESDTIQMTVLRLPVQTLAGEDGEYLEIRQEYHEDLLHGMKHRAHMKQDGDTLDPRQAEKSLELFTAAAKHAAREQQTRKHRAKSVVYGGL